MNPFVKANLEHLLRNKKILLGISGSIAAFKACDIVRSLKACGAQVRVILTPGAEKFVTPTTLEVLSGEPVIRNFSDGILGGSGTPHIEVARWADLILIAPATAQVIAKLAHGIADDFLSTEVLAFKGPLFIAPAMNPSMYAHPAVQENVTQLMRYGTRILGPTSGLTACGELGEGRMLEPEQIIEQVAIQSAVVSKNKHAIITLGPTQSAIDPVRYISNRSSGRMGGSLCWAAVTSGYQVTAICGPIAKDVILPSGIRMIGVKTASEMAEASLSCWPSGDIFISCAAVLDWDIRNPSFTKMKKNQVSPSLEFKENLDILQSICENKKEHQFVLGFAAETDAPLVQAFEKLRSKHCDALFVNDVSDPKSGFECESNSGWWVAPPDRVVELPSMPKPQIARQLISLIHGS